MNKKKEDDGGGEVRTAGAARMNEGMDPNMTTRGAFFN